MAGISAKNRARSGRGRQDSAPSSPPPDSAEMPTVENGLSCTFVPGRGCSITDVTEIVLMLLLQLSQGTSKFQPGALRHIAMDAERVALLSPSAQQWMQEINPPADLPEGMATT